jgi:glutamate-1-semialdehyde 2,1-aminomutase
LGGAQEVTGVIPDLATYAKAMAGGMPIAMLVGRAEIMDMLGKGAVYHGGSFNSNVMAMAAAHASLHYIMKDSGRFYRELNGKGLQLMGGLREAAKKAGSDLLVQGVGSVFATSFTAESEVYDYRMHARLCNQDKYRRFSEEMLKRGIRISANARWHMASSHTEEDIEKTVAAAEKVLRAI